MVVAGVAILAALAWLGHGRQLKAGQRLAFFHILSGVSYRTSSREVSIYRPDFGSLALAESSGGKVTASCLLSESPHDFSVSVKDRVGTASEVSAAREAERGRLVITGSGSATQVEWDVAEVGTAGGKSLLLLRDGAVYSLAFTGPLERYLLAGCSIR